MSKLAAARRLALFALLTGGLAACQRDITAPAPLKTAKATRDSIEGDSTLCRSGFIIASGKIICNESN